MCQCLLRMNNEKEVCMKQNINLKMATYSAKVWRPHLDVHIMWGVLSQQAGRKTSQKQKIQALNHQGNPGKSEVCPVTPLIVLK